MSCRWLAFLFSFPNQYTSRASPTSNNSDTSRSAYRHEVYRQTKSISSPVGIAFSTLWERIFGKEEMKVCILGLDNAGKTTVLYKLTLGEVVSTAPTVGSNVETFQHKNLNIRLWDIGGQSALRQSWAQYYAKARAIILVVDSTDRERLPLAKAELHKMSSDESLAGAAMLVLANKQDVRGCMNAAQISEGLDLTALKDRQWHIVACSALTGKGLEEGLDWLTLRLSGK